MVILKILYLKNNHFFYVIDNYYKEVQMALSFYNR